MKSQNMIYALKNDEIVHTSEVESGLKCECICPACGARLIARKGTKVLHHFFRINTIFWKDFTDFYGLTNISDMGRMLNETGRNEDGIEVYDWAFLIRSLLKMQSKGVGVWSIRVWGFIGSD
jgi:hypothetical protein